MSNRLVPSRTDLSPCECDQKGVTGLMRDPEAKQDARRTRDALIPVVPAEVVARNQRRLMEQLDAKGITPMTRERLREVATGKDLVSDEEFEEYLAFINDQRGR